MDFLGKDVILMGSYVSLKFQRMTLHQWCLRIYTDPSCHGQWCTRIHYICSFLYPTLRTDWTSVFPKNKLKHGFIWTQNKFSLSFDPLQMSSGPENPSEFLHKILRPKFFAILHWERLFLNSQINLSWSSAQGGEPWPIFACKDWAIGGCSFYTQSWYPHLLPVNLLI